MPAEKPNGTKLIVGITGASGVIYGVTLLRAQEGIAELAKKLDKKQHDEATGARIVLRALEEPLKQIAVCFSG